MNNKTNHSLSMLAWAYDERVIIEEFLDRALQLLKSLTDDYELLVVDDGSTDGTSEILEERARFEPRLRVLRHSKNLNVGHAIQTAFKEPSKEYVFFQTVDWSYDLSNASIFIRLLDDFDIVKGVRPVPERLLSHIPVLRSIYRVPTRSDTLIKALVSLANYYIVRLLYGVKFNDYQNIFFVRSDFMRALKIVSTSAFANPEFLIKSYIQGKKIIEVPINFLPRQKGVAKGTTFPFVVKTFVEVVWNWVKWGAMLRFKNKDKYRARVYSTNEPEHLSEAQIKICFPLLKTFNK